MLLLYYSPEYCPHLHGSSEVMISLSEEENSMNVSTPMSQGRDLEMVYSTSTQLQVEPFYPEFHLQRPSYLQGRLESILALLEEDERMDFAGQL